MPSLRAADIGISVDGAVDVAKEAVDIIRTPKIAFIQSRASWQLLGMTVLIMAIGVFLPMGPLAGYFKLEPLPLPFFGWLAAIVLGYVLLTAAMKRYYIRRFGWD